MDYASKFIRPRQPAGPAVKNPIVPHVLTWNALNGSGPVSNKAFTKRNAHLIPGDHMWVFAPGNRQ